MTMAKREMPQLSIGSRDVTTADKSGGLQSLAAIRKMVPWMEQFAEETSGFLVCHSEVVLTEKGISDV